MKYRKFNKYEKKEVRHEMLENALHGEGLYLFRNNTKADLTLPRPTRTGLRSLAPGKEFQGDNYYMQMVRTGMLRLVKEIQSPEQQRQIELNEAKIMEDKLILDQPDKITNEGTVEQVIKGTPKQNLNEGDSQSPKPDILLNEGPVEGGFVIVG